MHSVQQVRSNCSERGEEAAAGDHQRGRSTPLMSKTMKRSVEKAKMEGNRGCAETGKGV